MTSYNQEDRRVRRTKRLLKKAFVDLLHEKEYKSISVTNIVEKADFNRSTFYSHYNYKEELVEELNESLLNGLITAFFSDFKKGINNIKPSDILIFNYIYNKKEFFILWKTSEAIPHIQEVFIQKFSSLFKDALSELAEIDKNIDIELLVIYNTYGLLGLILDWIRRDFSEPADYMANQLIYLLRKINHK